MLYNSSRQGAMNPQIQNRNMTPNQISLLKNGSLNPVELGYSYQNPDFNVYGHPGQRSLNPNFQGGVPNGLIQQVNMANQSAHFQGLNSQVIFQNNGHNGVQAHLRNNLQGNMQNRMKLSQQSQEQTRMLQSQAMNPQLHQNFNVEKFYTQEAENVTNHLHMNMNMDIIDQGLAGGDLNGEQRESLASHNQLLQMEPPLTDVDMGDASNAEFDEYLEDQTSQFAGNQGTDARNDYLENANYTKNAMNQVQNLAGMVNQHMISQNQMNAQNNLSLRVQQNRGHFRNQDRRGKVRFIKI